MPHTLRISAIFIGPSLSLVLVGCGSDSRAPITTPTIVQTSTPSTPSTPTVTTVSVSGNAPNVGGTSQFTATAALSNGTTETVTAQATWTSSNASVATVSGTGLVTGVNPGSADISATYQNVSGASQLSVVRLTFTVSGTIRDGTSNGVLPNIHVSSVDSAGVTKTATTNGSGRYSIGGVAAGSVAITLSATSYLTTRQSITLAADTRVDLSLPRDDSAPPSTPGPSPTPAPPSPAPTSSFSMNPSSVDFGNQPVNTTSAPRTVTLTNISSTPQPVSPSTGGLNYQYFAFTTNCPSIVAAGASCTFNITFTPTATIAPGPCPWPASPCTQIGFLVVSAIDEFDGLVRLTGTGK